MMETTKQESQCESWFRNVGMSKKYKIPIFVVELVRVLFANLKKDFFISVRTQPSRWAP